MPDPARGPIVLCASAVALLQLLMRLRVRLHGVYSMAPPAQLGFRVRVSLARLALAQGPQKPNEVLAACRGPNERP